MLFQLSLTLDTSTLNLDETEVQDEESIKVKEEKSDADAKEKSEKNGTKNEDDDDDDVIEIIPQEPVITEILDEDEEIPEAQEKVDEKKEEESVKANESIGAESDVEIQEPVIPITDLDDIEDIPNSNISIDDSTQLSHGSPFAMVKIKEEPKDDDDEEDAFEEVGTVCPVDESILEEEKNGKLLFFFGNVNVFVIQY